MGRFATFGNDLYTGRRSIDFVERRKVWYVAAAVIVLACMLSLLVRGINPGIEFRGGSEFRVSGVSDPSEITGQEAVSSVVPGSEARVSVIGGDSVRVQTERLSAGETTEVAEALARDYGVQADEVTSSFVGPSWGRDVSSKAVQGLVVFILLVALVIALYFRTWKMAAAALVALVFDLIITIGVYALVGFEVTPASVIGLLTILGYSLYDTVVVFDKVRENTEHVLTSTKQTYAEAANLAINQTLVRSINTSIVGLLPVGSVLFIGAFLLGAGTLKDLSLALFVGIAAGTLSSIFIATPLLVDLRRREPEIAAHAEKVLRRRGERSVRAKGPVPPAEDEDDTDTGTDPEAAYAVSGGRSSGSPAYGTPPARGQRVQPKRGRRAGKGGRR